MKSIAFSFVIIAKKKDVTMATLSKEQKELLSTLFPDIDIRFW